MFQLSKRIRLLNKIDTHDRYMALYTFTSAKTMQK